MTEHEPTPAEILAAINDLAAELAPIVELFAGIRASMAQAPAGGPFAMLRMLQQVNGNA